MNAFEQIIEERQEQQEQQETSYTGTFSDHVVHQMDCNALAGILTACGLPGAGVGLSFMGSLPMAYDSLVKTGVWDSMSPKRKATMATASAVGIALSVYMTKFPLYRGMMMVSGALSLAGSIFFRTEKGKEVLEIADPLWEDALNTIKSFTENGDIDLDLKDLVDTSEFSAAQ